MTAVIGMREFSRNLNMLDSYDYVKLEDKKTHEKKGLYIPQKYADEIEKIMEEKIMQDRQAKFDRLKPFIGSMEVEDRYKGLEGKELMIEVAKAKVGM